MSKSFLIAFLATMVLIAGGVAYYSYTQRGNRLEPTGRILHVRSVSLDPITTVAVIDFSITNSSDREMVVRSVDVALHPQSGASPESFPIAATDLPSLFRYHRDELGAMGNAPIRDRERIAPHQTLMTSTGVRFDLPIDKVQARRDIQLTIEDVTGPKLELVAK